MRRIHVGQLTRRSQRFVIAVVLGAQLTASAEDFRSAPWQQSHSQSENFAPPANTTQTFELRMRRLEATNRTIFEQLEQERRMRQQLQADLHRQHMPRNGNHPIPFEHAGTQRIGNAPAREMPYRVTSQSQLEIPEPGNEEHYDEWEEEFEEEESEEIPLVGVFGEEGFELRTCDREFSLRFRLLDQTDYKVFAPGDQNPSAITGLYIPRVRLYFEGNLTEPIEYEVSLQRSLEGQFDLLDANFNVKVLDEKLQFRFGRTLAPYSYTWYDHLEQYFIAPERPLYPLNFGLSRSAGIVAHGFLRDEQLQYAVGGFDGRLSGIADNNTTQEAVGYLNLRPFLHSPGMPALKFLNIGGSITGGKTTLPQEPLPLRTSVQSSENDEAASSASAVLLEWNEGVTGFGGRIQGAIHLAWYYQQWSFEAEVQSGRSHLLNPESGASVPNTATGFHTSLAYMLTGETVEGRTTVVPLRPFDPRCGGLGAVEVYGRVSHLNIDKSVFEADLANPEHWSNDASLIDVGFNWYWNQYVKFYFVWQHAQFGSPVLVNEHEDRFSKSVDLFWMRAQVYF